METNRITPMVTELADNEVFVFGSNMQGMHMGGAAQLAHEKFGAEWGVHNGLTGQTYAIPTVDFADEITIQMIGEYVAEFIEVAKTNENMVFLVTEIGCGIAGYTVDEIAPMFEECTELDNVYLPKKFWRHYES